jgi:hypothetical protein
MGARLMNARKKKRRLAHKKARQKAARAEPAPEAATKPRGR